MGIKSILVSILLVSNSALATESLERWTEIATARCDKTEHPIIYTTDTRWGLSFLEMPDLARKFYVSPKRLGKRFYSDDSGSLRAETFGMDADLNVPAKFVYSIARHIEEALTLEYAQWIVFADMGHNHFFITEETNQRASQLDRKGLLETYMNADDTKMLYHTLEQIQVKDPNTKALASDAWSQWRYYTRNIVGDNRGEGRLEIFKNLEGKYNTVSEPPAGSVYYGAGVNVSSNENGCFPYTYRGKTYYFDVSFFDLAPDPAVPVDEYYRVRRTTER